MSAREPKSFDPRVAAVRAGPSAYGDDSEMSGALARLATELGWWEEARGALANVIHKGARVLIKPNFVMHENKGEGGMTPLVTHQSLIKATVEASLSAGASEVLVGDAPLQGCDFDVLLRATGLDEWAVERQKRDPRFKGVRDFRRTTATFVGGVRVASEGRQAEDRFVLFDLGSESLLEPITDESEAFRVTCYDPRLMAKTHAPGRHQYLVAREILEADIVIDLPKLKTHMKAGVTCALKNLIGINGNKEYLPHHRIGGLELGGDCYPGDSKLKRALEVVADRQNMTESYAAAHVWQAAARVINRALHMKGDQLGIEGSWSGNDTIWRTCLDLNRILLHGRVDSTMAEMPQRKVIHIVDAIVAGQGNGPLSPTPLSLGLILAGTNAVAVDWVGASLLGYMPERIPIVREAFGKFRWPLAEFSGEDILLAGDLGVGTVLEVLSAQTPPVITYPVGWRDAAPQLQHHS